MPTTTVLDGDGTDWTAAVRALGARTDNAGTAVTDLAADEDRLINHVLTEGFLTSGAFQVTDGASGMQVTVGSGTAKADIYVVEGDDVGQHPYLVRMDDATVTITLDAGDADPRIDEIYLVVRDKTYDGGTLSEAQLAVRKGDAAASPSAPGPDASWDAEVLLASISVAASASTVAAGDITDKRATSNLNAVLGDALAARFADVAGDTFTGAVAFQAGVDSTMAAVAATAAVSNYPDGYSAFKVSADSSWPSSNGMVVTFNEDPADHRVLQLFQDISDSPVLYYRRWKSTASAWTAWQTFTTAQKPNQWEVDNSTEVAGPTSLTTAYASVASVNLSIPSDWASWKCSAHATFRFANDGTTRRDYNMRIVIDGTAQQEGEGNDTEDVASVGGRRTGMTTTGSRTVALQAKTQFADTSEVVSNIFLYARAVRTS